MLVLSRRESESVVLLNKETMELVGVVSVVEVRSAKARIGFHFFANVAIFRQELTSLRGMSFVEICKVPIGTIVSIKPKKDSDEAVRMEETPVA